MRYTDAQIDWVKSITWMGLLAASGAFWYGGYLVGYMKHYEFEVYTNKENEIVIAQSNIEREEDDIIVLNPDQVEGLISGLRSVANSLKSHASLQGTARESEQ